jgi:hypothetical protein
VRACVKIRQIASVNSVAKLKFIKLKTIGHGESTVDSFDCLRMPRLPHVRCIYCRISCEGTKHWQVVRYEVGGTRRP